MEAAMVELYSVPLLTRPLVDDADLGQQSQSGPAR